MSTERVRVNRYEQEDLKTGPTTYQSQRSYASMSEAEDKKDPIVKGRQLIIVRGSNEGSLRSMSHGVTQSMVPVGAYQKMAEIGVTDVKSSRGKEKKEMQKLNERLFSYIKKIKDLEAENKNGQSELKVLREKVSKQSSGLKELYEPEIQELRKLNNEAENAKNKLEIRCQDLEEILGEKSKALKDIQETKNSDKDIIGKQHDDLSNYEAEIKLLRRRLETLENDRGKDKNEIKGLNDKLQRTRDDMNTQTLNYIDAENRRQTLQEELDLLKEVHKQELLDLGYRTQAADLTPEDKQYWKNEMGQAMRELQKTYDEKLEEMLLEQEMNYKSKIEELKNGTQKRDLELEHSKNMAARLREQIKSLSPKVAELQAKNAQLEKENEFLKNDQGESGRFHEERIEELTKENAMLRAEMTAIVEELKLITDAKLGMELEIAAYRKLLDGEDSRVSLKNVVDGFLESGAKKDKPLPIGDMKANTTKNVQAKGPIRIADSSLDGKWVLIENTGRKDENLSSWEIVRTIEGREHTKYRLKNFTIKYGQKIKLYAKGQKDKHAGRDDIELYDLNTWGSSKDITTTLVSEWGEDRATLIQKTEYHM